MVELHSLNWPENMIYVVERRSLSQLMSVRNRSCLVENNGDVLLQCIVPPSQHHELLFGGQDFGTPWPLQMLD